MTKNIYNDFDKYLKNQKEIESEIDIFQNFKDLITEIKQSRNLSQFLIERSRTLNITKQNETTMPRKYSSPALLKKTLLSSSHSSKNSFGIFNTNLVNYFDQSNLKTVKALYKKKNEFELMGNKIREKVSLEVRKKFMKIYNEYNEQLKYLNKYDETNNSKIYLKKLRKLNNSYGSNNSSDNEKLEKLNDSKGSKGSKGSKVNRGTNILVNTNLNIQNNNVETRLYPEPEKKEELLTERFVKEKMLEFRFNGGLNKKVNVDDIVKKFKINDKKKEYNENIYEKINQTDRVVNDFFNAKLKKFGNKKLSNNNLQEEFKDIIIETQSKNYIKINRKDKNNLCISNYINILNIY
jgi:hypothetical protein